MAAGEGNREVVMVQKETDSHRLSYVRVRGC